MGLVSGFQLPDSSKYPENPKNNDDVIFRRNDVIVGFFWRCRIIFVKLHWWSKFEVNIITGSWVMIIFIYKGFDLKYGNWQDTRLQFGQYLENGLSYSA